MCIRDRTSSGRYCIEGITRGEVLHVAQRAGIITRQTDFALRKVYSADEAFCTGTFGGIMPVTSVDGRRIGSGGRGPVTERLQQLYAARIEEVTG